MENNKTAGVTVESIAQKYTGLRYKSSNNPGGGLDDFNFYHGLHDDIVSLVKSCAAIPAAGNDLKEAMEECERLAKLVEYWQGEYYKFNPRYKKSLDFNQPTPIIEGSATGKGEEQVPVEAVHIIDDLINAIPGQTEDVDWWPDELRKAIANANKFLSSAQVIPATQPSETVEETERLTLNAKMEESAKEVGITKDGAYLTVFKHGYLSGSAAAQEGGELIEFLEWFIPRRTRVVAETNDTKGWKELIELDVPEGCIELEVKDYQGIINHYHQHLQTIKK